MAPLCSEVDQHFESGRKDILAYKTAAFGCYSDCNCSGLLTAFYNKIGYLLQIPRQLASFCNPLQGMQHIIKILKRYSGKIFVASY